MCCLFASGAAVAAMKFWQRDGLEAEAQTGREILWVHRPTERLMVCFHESSAPSLYCQRLVRACRCDAAHHWPPSTGVLEPLHYSLYVTCFFVLVSPQSERMLGARLVVEVAGAVAGEAAVAGSSS